MTTTSKRRLMGQPWRWLTIHRRWFKWLIQVVAFVWLLVSLPIYIVWAGAGKIYDGWGWVARYIHMLVFWSQLPDDHIWMKKWVLTRGGDD